MLENLKFNMKMKGISLRRMARELKIPYSTLCDKVHGRTQFTVDEAKIIHDIYFQEVDFLYLFKKEQS